MRTLVALLVLGACSGTAAPAGVNRAAEAVLVAGEDVVLRTEPDGTVTVVTSRTLHDTVGFGTVRLRTNDLQTAATSPHLRYARARAFHVLAEKLAATPEHSYEAAKLGVAQLGDDYLRPKVMDDSGNKLAMADDMHANQPDKRARAAELAREVLAHRLRSYAVRWQRELL